jgi:hypothetical protein
MSPYVKLGRIEAKHMSLKNSFPMRIIMVQSIDDSFRLHHLVKEGKAQSSKPATYPLSCKKRSIVLFSK